MRAIVEPRYLTNGPIGPLFKDRGRSSPKGTRTGRSGTDESIFYAKESIDVYFVVAAPRPRHRTVEQARLGHPPRAVRRHLPRCPRRFDDRRRPALDPRGPRDVDQLAAMGDQRLCPWLRRVPAPGRTRRRSPRPTADVPDLNG